MFLFNYRYRLKCILRDRQLMFWTLLFPILLATLFNLALSKIATKFRWLSSANAELDANPAFSSALEGTGDLFVVTHTTQSEAEALL